MYFNKLIRNPLSIHNKVRINQFIKSRAQSKKQIQDKTLKKNQPLIIRIQNQVPKINSRTIHKNK